jgi:signal recognition particle subunit SRP54
VERAQRAFDEEEARRINQKIRKNQIDFNDFLSQLQQIKRMGNLKDLIGMIPGMSAMMKDVAIDDDAFKPIEAIILSMTPKERSNPELVNNASRKKRIAAGSGTSIVQVNNLLKQFDAMRTMMKKMNQMNPAQLQKMAKKRR